MSKDIPLKEQVEFYSSLLDNCSDLIHSVTPEGTFLYVNQAWRDTLGYSNKDIEQLSLMDIVDEKCRNKCRCIFDALISGEQIDRNETVFRLYKEALDNGTPYDAVLMDLTIPGGMGGKETMAGLLEIDPEAKGIASSGYANDPIMAHFNEYGFAAVIPKPYQIDELRAILTQTLSTDS